MDDPRALPLPVAGEIDDECWDQIAGGQPVLLLRSGVPAAIVVDVDSWTEATELADLAIRSA